MRMEEELECKGDLPPRQIAFSKGSSIVDVIKYLLNYEGKSKNSGAVILIDSKNAFNTTIYIEQDNR